MDNNRVTRTFGVCREHGQNPYSGIMSFQHFRGEKLYSDIIVKPENNYCETENVECYPVPDDVPQNGREEGYYPDNTVAYIRVLWKEFEPRRGEYNYSFIQDILDDTKAHSQTLIFRLLPHSTRASDDVPDWLKEMIPCPERPDGERVKDSPTDPLFIELFCQAVRKLGERFDKDPYFDAIDISLPGSWGEGHELEKYPEEDILKMIDTYIESFPNTQLMGQCHRTDFLYYIRKKGANIGWRGDGLGNPPHTHEKYPTHIPKIADFWKDAPVSFEAYWWLGEWKRKGWDIDEVIEKTLEWHISSFNPKSIPIPYEWQEKVEYWLSKMGYHYAIDSFTAPGKACKGEELHCTLCVDNIGVAPSYHTIPLFCRLKNEQDEYVFETTVNICDWMPGKHTEELHISLPETLKAGKYDIAIGIYNDVAKTVYFATDAPFDGRFYTVGQVEVQ